MTRNNHCNRDLYGQLRFLRVPQFCRPDFWKQNVDTPYVERNYDVLCVLRTLLSHVVIRHSKEQTLQNGNALLSLPPRTVETLLLPFGSDAEKQVYDYIEKRNTQKFMELRSDSPQAVLGKFIELNAMLYTSRQVCAHSSIVNLENMQILNEKHEREKKRFLGFQDEVKHRKKGRNTRAGILEEAISKARVSARGRMREIILEFHEGEVEYMECPICLEATGEKDIALTPCAHKFCGECILNCLQSTSSSREAQGSCPKCRDNIKRSELTFLGDAKEAGEKAATKEEDDDDDEKCNEENADINGFQLLTKDVSCTTSGANDRRADKYYQPLSKDDERNQRAFYNTLSPEFLASYNTASSSIGTKVSRLLQEIKLMIQKDPTSKCVVFSQFLTTLDVAGQEMTARGLTFARVDGGMKQHQRADSILSFTSDPNTRILLLSMRGKTSCIPN
jgi:SNF2 family DNA or RNA helicase